MNTKLSLTQAYSLLLCEYPDVLSTKDVCKILGLSNKTLLRLIHSGQITSIKIGHSYRIPKLHLFQFLGILSENPFE